MANKQIILMRHAKSDWSSGAQSDHNRPLNSRGRKNALRVGQWFVENGYQPEEILCSDAARTQETLDLVVESSGWSEFELKIRILGSLYLASKKSIISTINAALVSTDRVMLVGHNPGMDLVLHGFCPEVNPDENGKLMTTAAFAIINFATIKLANSNLDNPNLIEFYRPKELN